MRIGTLTVLSGIAIAASAQEPVRREVRAQTFEATPLPGPVGAGAIHFMAAGPGAGKAIQGAPYSAESMTEYVRTLADGTRITRRTNAKFARDSQGRTRDEQSVPGLGPWASGDGVRMVTIFDPVAKEMFILNEKEKTAQRIKLSGPASVSWSSSSSSSNSSNSSGSGAAREVRVERRVQVIQAGSVGVAGSLAMPTAPSGILMRRGDARTESLGTQTMEGLQVQGTRVTRTVPAGEMGNDRALVSTEERWESTELKTVVRSNSHDPEFGDTSFRLTNISRTEPAKSLFQVPADYRIEDGPQAMRMEIGNRP